MRALSLVDRVCRTGVESVDPALGMYVRRLNAFTFITGTLILVVALKRFAQGAPITAAIEVSVVAMMHVLRFYALWRPSMRRFRFAGQASIAMGMCGIVGTAMTLGQLHSPSLWYLGLLPLAGGYYGGARGALSWGLLACAAIVVVALTALVVYIPPEVVQTDADALATLIVVLLTTTGFAATAQRSVDSHLLELQAREDKIRAQAGELGVARDAALEASRLKSTFLANMSHEIRTPMNVIIGMTDIVLESRLEPTARGYLERARAGALTLLAILNDILDLSKIEAGKAELEIGALDVAAIADEVVQLFACSATSKGLLLVARTDGAVPSGLRGDGKRLRQVLTNLVGNAIKFTQRGGVVVETRLVGETPASVEVSFVVRDTGIGIPADRQAAVFESFTQVDGGTTSTYGGTGLGLTISRQIVELMGGTLRLESTVGEGSTFWFVLVLERHAGAAAAPGGPPRESGPPLESKKHKREQRPQRALASRV